MIKKILIGILAVFGILFVILLAMPDDDEGEQNYGNENVTETTVPSDNAPVLAAGVDTVFVDTDAKSATIMIYMNGSDLETQAGEATEDIREMLASGIGENVNVIIQTMGTKEWQKYGISESTAQTYRLRNGNLELIRDGLGQLDCTVKDTLSEFIKYGKNAYPADRYLFLFWDHGGGPVYGFGYDEWQADNESLTIAEMSRAFAENSDIHFDMIGMDCCIMASVETCYALAPYCSYTLLSEDFESGLGWEYTGWMKAFEENPGISTPLLGKYIIEDIIEKNENSYDGDSACIGLFNEATAKDLFTVWKNYAYKNEAKLLGKNYSRMHKSRGRYDRGFWDLWDLDDSDVTLSDYYISDILALVESIDNDSDEAKALMSTLKAAVAYYGHTSDKNELTGLAVSLPYGDSEFYAQLRDVYEDLNFDRDYIDWLENFVSAENSIDYYDYDTFDNSWLGWGSYENDYGCNISNGSCEYGYDYDDEDEDWIYDYEEEIWYMYEDDTLYLYDDETDTLYYYDEENDQVYSYDEDTDDWILTE